MTTLIPRTRSTHLAWCKARALENLPHDPHAALVSFVSGFGKDPSVGTQEDTELLLTMIPLHMSRPTAEAVEKWLERWV